MTAHKKGGGPGWRNYQPPGHTVKPQAPRESWWTLKQSWDEFSREAAIEAERMQRSKAPYTLAIDRFAVWG